MEEATPISIERSADLARIPQFIADHLHQRVASSPEEALDLWRTENPISDDFQDTVHPLREAPAGMEEDTGVPLEEFDRLFRGRRDLSSS